MSSVRSQLIVPDWPAHQRVRAFATTRAGGVSTGAFASLNLGVAVGDDPEHVAINRDRVCALLPSTPCWLKQVHGNVVINAGAHRGAIPEADSSYARVNNVVCVIQMADCLPVLFAAKDGSAIAAAHAGWRGLAAGVLENTISALGIPVDQMIAWLGPAIGPEAFEVGDDVRDVFINLNAADQTSFRAKCEGKWMADLFELACARLQRAGVHEIFGGGLCTHSDPQRFFSHRRDRVSGRMAALIWLQD